MMVIDNKYKFGDVVYLLSDAEQKERIVRGFYVTQSGIEYELACGTEGSSHYEFEITLEKDILKTIKD